MFLKSSGAMKADLRLTKCERHGDILYLHHHGVDRKAGYSLRPPIRLGISQMSEFPMESEVMEQCEMQPENSRNGLSDPPGVL